MNNNIKNKKFLKIFLSLIFVLFALLTHKIYSQINKCDCGLYDCPHECRYCYDCLQPCECRPISPCHGAPFLQYRPQGLNKAKEIAGWQPYVYRYGKKDTYGTLSTAIEFTSSFRANRIAQYLFGNDLINGKTLLVQGSGVENRHPKAWLADYFGLPTDFESAVSFCPKIKNIILDLYTHIAIDRVAKGVYFKVHFPIASTRWELNMSECVKTSGQEPFEIGYMGLFVINEEDKATSIVEPIPRENLPANFMCAIQGNTTFGDLTHPIQFGRMPCKQLKRTMLADIHGTFGYNFIHKKDYTLGVNIHGVFPTGNRPDARTVFEPIVGNGRHWELGLGVNSSWVFYRNKDNENSYMGIWLDATATHLFKTCQARSFDFCGKPNSRYMLLIEMMTQEESQEPLEQLGLPGSVVFGSDDFILLQPNPPVFFPTGSLPIANYVYKLNYDEANNIQSSNIIPAINYTTRLVDTRIDIQVDLAVKLGYKSENFSFDIGYNFWFRTREKITPCKNYCKNEPDPRYVIKGDTPLWLRTYLGFPQEEVFRMIHAGSQSNANIHSGENMKLSATDAARNKGVDNPKLAWLSRTAFPSVYIEDETNPDDISYSSFNPILISPLDINTCQSAMAMTHKIFMHINYAWKDELVRWEPFAGFGGQAEFAPENRKYRAISQWGIWAKAGVAFK